MSISVVAWLEFTQRQISQIEWDGPAGFEVWRSMNIVLPKVIVAQRDAPTLLPIIQQFTNWY